MADDFLQPEGQPRIHFSRPVGEAALIAHDSVAWQVFRNPVALFVGGVAAVLLELAEPRVRAGVWDNSSFRTDPVDRLRRTGLAAMVTVYAARSVADEMIAGIRGIHDRIEGVTPAGEPYRANDPELLDWVQATASYGFLEAYSAFVRPLSPAQRDSFYAEAVPAARLYGAVGAPRSEAEMKALLERMRPRLERSDVILDFIGIIRGAEILPTPLRPIQHMLIRAATDILPDWFRRLTGLDGLGPFERPLVAAMARSAGAVRLDRSPPAHACIRLGLAPDHLWKAALTSSSIRSSSPS
jgi:uncharacterized protein (DUF2236 family)